MARQSNLLFFQKLMIAARSPSLLTLAIVIAVMGRPAPSPAASAKTSSELTPDVVFRKYKNAIVRIEVFLAGASLGVGTGFFVSKSGEIATNLHVIRPLIAHPHTTIEVKTADGRIFKTAHIGACGDARGIDLCLLKVKYKPSVIMTLSDQEATPGESIVTIGHPRGLDFSISKGIISAVRNHPSGWREIQTDAAISPGNSGGPIINDRGQVIGVVYQYERDGQNLNFGIHSSEAAHLFEVGAAYREIDDARKHLAAHAIAADRKLIADQIAPALIGLKHRVSVAASPGLRWTKIALGNESFFFLAPTLFQSCERMDESESALASTCQSVGGEWSVTVQKRPRSLAKRLLGFNSTRLVEPKSLTIADHLEGEGRAPASHLNWFRSTPSTARCALFSPGAGFFSSAHSACHFDTENDTDPGAASASIWIDSGRNFYGINVWTADPARLPYAREITKLIAASATKIQPRMPSSTSLAHYWISPPPSLVRAVTTMPTSKTETIDTYKSDRQILLIVERSATTEPSGMARDLRELSRTVADHFGLVLDGVDLAQLQLHSFEFDGATSGLWANTVIRDKSARQTLLQISSRYEKNSTFYIVMMTNLESDPVHGQKKQKPVDQLYDAYRVMLRSFRRIK